MPGAASFLCGRRCRRRGSRRQAGRPGTLAPFLSLAVGPALPLPTPTHTLPHTHSAASSSLARLPCARAHPRSHPARAPPAETAPRYPRPSASVRRVRGRPSRAPAPPPHRGGAGEGSEAGPGLAGLPPAAGPALRAHPPRSQPSPASRAEERQQSAHAGRSTGARESFKDALSPSAPKPSSLRKGNGWGLGRGVRYVSSSKPRGLFLPLHTLPRPPFPPPARSSTL